MATGKYVRIVAQGEYFSGAFTGEIFQTGISVVQSDNGGDFPGGIKVVPSGFTAEPAAVTADNAVFNIDRAWEGADKFTFADQDAIASAMNVFLNAIRGLQYTSQRWTQVRLSAFDAAGKVINGASVYTFKTPLAGTAAVSVIPPVLAVTATLRTGARGPSGRGRMFLPTPQATSTGGILGGGAQTTCLAAVKALCEDLWQDAQAVPCVFSQTHGYYSGISKVAVGNLWDVQRRRDAAIRETYSEQAPAY